MVGPVVDRLRADDHSVIFVAEMWPGIGDTEVLAVSRSAEALPITADKDFGELVFRQGLRLCGVLLIRWAGIDGESGNCFGGVSVTRSGFRRPVFGPDEKLIANQALD